MPLTRSGAGVRHIERKSRCNFRVAPSCRRLLLTVATLLAACGGRASPPGLDGGATTILAPGQNAPQGIATDGANCLLDDF
jgi:hypothetical protein